MLSNDANHSITILPIIGHVPELMAQLQLYERFSTCAKKENPFRNRRSLLNVYNCVSRSQAPPGQYYNKQIAFFLRALFFRSAVRGPFTVDCCRI